MPTTLIIGGMTKSFRRQMRIWNRRRKKEEGLLKAILSEWGEGGSLDVPSTTIAKTNIEFLVDFFALICSTCQSIVRRAEDSIHPEISSILGELASLAAPGRVLW